MSCREPQKGPKFSCSNFEQLKDIDSILELDQLQIVPDGEDEEALVSKPKKKKIKSAGPVEIAMGPADASLEEDPLKDDFVWEAMQKAYDPLTNTVRDLKIDDSALPRAKNYYHFCSKVAGTAIKLPFSRQLWIATHLYGEYCPRCTHKNFGNINKIPVDMDSTDLVDNITLLENGRCPKCKASKAKLVINKELLDYNQLVMVAGQRAGKSALTSTMAAYHLHLMLKAPRLSTICRGIQDFTPLTGTFVALSQTRSIKLLWNPFAQIVEASSWFQDLFSLLDHAGSQYDKEFYRKSTLYMRFYHRNLDYYPMGPMKRTLRGDTRCFSATDELGWFPYKETNYQDQDDEELEQVEDDEEDERERANGDEVHQSLDNSLATVRAEVWDLYKRDISSIPTGLNVNISSPQSWKDKICRLLKDSEDPATLSLGLRLPTWEINPIFTRDHPIITSAYAKNFRRADRDYGANPPKLSATLFIKEAVQKSFHGKQHYTVTYNEDEPEYTVGKLKELIVKNKWEACTMGMDAGLNNNSFAIAVGSRAETLVNTHCIFELIPSRTKPVFYPRLYRDVLLPLIKACNVVYVGADRWNSINLLQQIQEDTKGRTKTMMLTLNTNHFNYFKDLVNTNNLILPEMEWAFDTVEGVNNYKRELKNHPIEHLYLQFLTVREQLAGVGKGEGNTDDLWRALVVMSTMHFIPKVKEYLGEFKAQERTDTSSRSTVLLAGRSGLGYLR